MAKIGIFKKVAALATAIAIVVCFAVSAGAVTVTTTTSYVDGAPGDILVDVTISGEDIQGKSVSYYAYDKNNSPVYIDQFEDGEASVTFDYVTNSANLNSDVRVGYTGASEAEEAYVDGDKVTLNGDAASAQYIPTAATNATVVFATTATEVVSYEATGATISSASITGDYLTVILTDINAEKGNIDLTIATETEATVELIDAAFVICAGANDTGKLEAVTSINDRKLTAIGKAKGTDDFGIIVSATASYTGDNKFQAIANNGTMDGITANGYYAVQLIDDVSDDIEFLTADAYYVGAYADTAVDMYEVDDVVTPISIKDLR